MDVSRKQLRFVTNSLRMATQLVNSLPDAEGDEGQQSLQTAQSLIRQSGSTLQSWGQPQAGAHAPTAPVATPAAGPSTQPQTPPTTQAGARTPVAAAR